MSVTFTPTAGTWTSYTYYDADNEPDAVNGIIRFESDEPSLNCHNSGAHDLLVTLGLPDDELCGTIVVTPAFLAHLDDVLHAERVNYGDNAYIVRKLESFRPLVLHSLYHGCDIHYA